LQNCRAVEVLQRSLAGNRLAHGILLHGESRQHLLQVGEAIAGHLLGKTKQPFAHPDCFLLRPSGRARQIKVGKSGEHNTMRELVVNIAKSANQGGRKVALVIDADRMHAASANAFLKTLEEPPAGSTLLLLTTRPYELLDTIRSRCLNFRIPAPAEAVDHPQWSDWLRAYRQWLGHLLKGPRGKTVSEVMMGAYGLNARFQKILAEITQTQWQADKAELPDGLSSEEQSAMEAGLSKGFRQQLLSEIERATLQFARDVEALNAGALPAEALHRSTEALEKSARLMDINFNQAAALELFFLRSLRIWAAARS
jgi:DNA polymerase-3 subunit delta'